MTDPVYPTPPIPTDYPIELARPDAEIQYNDAGFLAEVIYHADDNGPNRQMSAKIAQAVLGNGYRRILGVVPIPPTPPSDQTSQPSNHIWGLATDPNAPQ